MIHIKDTDYIIAFGKHLKELRKSKGLSQEELADGSGISVNQVGRIERGEINTTISTLFILSKTLNMHPKELLNFDVK